MITCCPDLQKDKCKKESSKKESKEKSHVNMGRSGIALMASTSFDIESKADSEEEDEIFFELTCDELVVVVKDLIIHCKSKSFIIHS